MNKKKESKVVPNVRFKGFTDDWKQRKLGKMMNITSVKRIHQSDWTDSGVRFLRARDIVAASKNEEPDDYLYISEEKYEEYSALSGKVDINDLLVTGVGTIGVPYLVENLEPLYFKDGNIIWFKNKNKIDGKFLYYSFIGNGIQSFIKASAGTGTVGTYTIDTGKKTPIQIPSKEEQRKIGEYLTNIDHLITLHQRKIDKLKNLKKSMLEKMFPKKGSLIPEFRFNGFANAWEQRKLGNVAKFSKGSGYSKGDLIESGTPIILYGRLYTKYETSISEVDTYVEAKDGSVYSKGGEVIVPASGETAEDIARAATVDKSGVILGGDLNVVSPNEDINSAFLAISISHGNSQRELAKKAQGKSVVHIHNEEIKNLVVPFPTKAEQNKIVEYFSNLDNLITLHQRKIDKIKNMKKAMLNQMFI